MLCQPCLACVVFWAKVFSSVCEPLHCRFANYLALMFFVLPAVSRWNRSGGFGLGWPLCRSTPLLFVLASTTRELKMSVPGEPRRRRWQRLAVNPAPFRTEIVSRCHPLRSGGDHEAYSLLRSIKSDQMVSKQRMLWQARWPWNVCALSKSMCSSTFVHPQHGLQQCWQVEPWPLSTSLSLTAQYLWNPGSHRELRMVPPVPVLGLSPASRSSLGLRLRWLGPFLPASVPSHFPRFCI